MLIGSACVLSHVEAAAQGKREAKTVGGGTAKPMGPVEHLLLVADRDDDDADDTPDAEAAFLAPAGRVDLVTLDARYAGATLTPRTGAEAARVLVNG